MYDYDTCSEQALVKRACQQDAHAFSKLYETVYQDLFRFALYTLKHTQDAEDVVSETVISAYENIGKLRETDAFRGWIFRILANACKKKLLTYRTKLFELEETDIVADIDYGAAQEVREAFKKLDSEERLIVSLSVFAGYNSKEIGSMLDLNANTVRSKRSRALSKMEQTLAE